MNGIHEFVFRGVLAEEALDRAGRKARNTSGFYDADVANALSIDLLDSEYVVAAKRMAAVYTAIAAFENSVRDFVKGVLLEKAGEDWWSTCASEKIRKRAESRKEEENKIRWHTRRGQDLLNYTEMGDLVSLMRNNQEAFEPYIRSVEWAASLIGIVERSRNVIMHSGVLDPEDVERLGMNIRDWVKQVGT
jgi:hypothetical protein